LDEENNYIESPKEDSTQNNLENNSVELLPGTSSKPLVLVN